MTRRWKLDSNCDGGAITAGSEGLSEATPLDSHRHKIASLLAMPAPFLDNPFLDGCHPISRDALEGGGASVSLNLRLSPIVRMRNKIKIGRLASATTSPAALATSTSPMRAESNSGSL